MHSQRKGPAAVTDPIFVHSKTEQLEVKVRQLEASRLELRDEVNDALTSRYLSHVYQSLQSQCEFVSGD